MSRVRGIVLAGTYHWSGSAFEDLLPRPLVPVAQAPLVSYALRWLRDGGISRATLCANSASRAMRSYLGAGSRLTMSLEYHEDWTPRGAAGCVRDAATRSDADTLVVTDGTAIPAVNIGLLLDDHRTAGAAVTIVVHHDRQARSGERPLNPGGIYVFDRRVLDYIPETGFQDIKENLIPKLYRAGERVVTHAGLGVCPAGPERRDLSGREPLDDRADRRRPLSARALGHVRGERRGARAPHGLGRSGRTARGSGAARPLGQDRGQRHHRGSDQPGGGDAPWEKVPSCRAP